ARGGGAGAGLDVLLALLAGRAQVDVRVEEGGEGVQAFGVDLLDAGRVGASGRSQLGDPAVADDEVVDAVDPGDRVEQGGAAEDEVGRLARPHVEDIGEVDGAGAHAGCPIVGAAAS